MSSYGPSLQLDCIVAATVVHSVFYTLNDNHPLVQHSGARKRMRRSVHEIFDCLGPAYFRRAYHMTYGDDRRKLPLMRCPDGMVGADATTTALMMVGSPPPMMDGPLDCGG